MNNEISRFKKRYKRIPKITRLKKLRLTQLLAVLRHIAIDTNEDTFLLITTWQKFAPYSLGFGKKKKIKSLSKKKERKNMLEKSIGG